MFNRVIKNIFVLSAVACILSGCASIVRDNPQPVSIKSNVKDVNIKITDSEGDTVFQGKTPAVVNLRTAKESGYFSPEKYSIEASKEGYNEHLQSIDSHISNWYIFGNLGFGGLIGYLIVDPMTGDMYYLDEDININMTPLPIYK
ncbi:MAG: hypothetical protein IKW39_00480 [Alphaproteobacteria bacterium]|nr:hypothetical protein [Alphaproteobacteria bacterium]